MVCCLCVLLFLFTCFFFFFNDTATTEIYTLSLHDALPICTFLVSNLYDYDESVVIFRSNSIMWLKYQDQLYPELHVVRFLTDFSKLWVFSLLMYLPIRLIKFDIIVLRLFYYPQKVNLSKINLQFKYWSYERNGLILIGAKL